MAFGSGSSARIMPIPSKYILPLFFLALLLGAMILGPLLYFALAPIWPIPFHRAVDRALLISAVGTLFLFRSRIPLGKLWPLNGDAWKQALLGFVMAFVTAQALIGFDLALGGFTSAHLSTSQAANRVLLALVAALVIPPLEETIFRGFMQGELSAAFGWRGGWIVTAVIFTLAHFVKAPVELDHQPVHLWSGASALGAAFLPLIHGAFLSGKGLNLFLLGLILGGVVLRSGTLWVNAGLHGGLILALLLFTGFTRPVEIAFLGGDILSSPLTSVVLILLGLWLWLFYRHPSILPETGENAP